MSADPAPARGPSPSPVSVAPAADRAAAASSAAGGWLGVSLGCAGLTVLGQVAYPLLDGSGLTVATVVSVLSFAAASLTHAVWAFGARAAALTGLCAAGLGLLAESVGVATGIPFGGYRYAASLGLQLAGVPLLVPLAWMMMAYPALLLARRLVGGRASGRGPVAVVGGWTLAAWDLFLDPQMVDAGHWSWTSAHPHLPGVPGIPLSNGVGWLLVGTLMIALLDRVLPRTPRKQDRPLRDRPPGRPRRAGAWPFDAVPAALLGWTWLGSTLANLAFFDRPWVAAYGGAAMAATVGPYLLAVRRAAR